MSWAEAERLLKLGIDSPTLKKAQCSDKLRFQFLCDLRQDVKDKIGRESTKGCSTGILACVDL